jgi:hypothetical protein
MTDGLKKDFEDAGFKIEIKQLADFQDAYGLEGEEDDEDDDEDMSGSEDDSESGSEMEE